MKRWCNIGVWCCCLLCGAGTVMAAEPADTEGGTGTITGSVTITDTEEKKPIRIEEVTITGTRPIRDIGVQRTEFAPVALQEHVALSMADVLSFHSSVFVKNHGRATLSTVAFRGTSPSHTQVTWNGMRINSPMLGMTDFSMIPSYFVDEASLLHGSSSASETGGGLGGAVKLATRPSDVDGFGLKAIQGIGSYGTFDEFLQVQWGDAHWQLSTRAVYTTSRNNFHFRNRNRKENIYDDDRNIIGNYYPIECNRNGAFRDLNLLQEVYRRTDRGDRFGLNLWYTSSHREMPMLASDYADRLAYENLQREQTLRSVLSWERIRENLKMSARAGYIYTWLAYDYQRDPGNGTLAPMTRSRSRVQTLYGQLSAERTLGNRWLFTADLAAYQHFVRSADRNILLQNGNHAIVGYDQGRLELSASVSAKWRPVDRFGMSVVLREECFGSEWTPPVPALFIDGLLSKRGNVIWKSSLSRNFRFPTLNDLYFLPGGNPDLHKEHGWSWDTGVSFATGKEASYKLSGSATWFDARIDDWIIWLPTLKGFFSPRNLKSVHAYGVELQGSFSTRLGREWRLDLNATGSWTPSINVGEKLSPADRSVGKQLPYVPEFSATCTGMLTWRNWSFNYKWCFYSERYTMSNESRSLTGRLPAYFMNHLTLERRLPMRWGDLSLKAAVENLFDEEYLSVLDRPMPGIHFEIFIGITPHWGKKAQ